MTAVRATIARRQEQEFSTLAGMGSDPKTAGELRVTSVSLSFLMDARVLSRAWDTRQRSTPEAWRERLRIMVLARC